MTFRTAPRPRLTLVVPASLGHGPRGRKLGGCRSQTARSVSSECRGGCTILSIRQRDTGRYFGVSGPAAKGVASYTSMDAWCDAQRLPFATASHCFPPCPEIHPVERRLPILSLHPRSNLLTRRCNPWTMRCGTLSATLRTGPWVRLAMQGLLSPLRYLRRERIATIRAVLRGPCSFHSPTRTLVGQRHPPTP